MRQTTDVMEGLEEALQSPSDAAATERPSFVGYPFTLGVASGSPLPTGVVLWTRLAPDPLHGGGVEPGAVVVRWEVAEDERFARVVQRGSVEAVRAWAHSVHVEVTGLEPSRWYFYRFLAGSEVSPVGRTRTAPAAAELPPQLRFGLGSCQHFEFGYYAAHRHLAAEELDLMVFVGDYIYEGTGRPGRARRHAGGEARTLDQYRNRHAQYKTDPDLQRLHAAVPWLVTWDDHEVDNDYAGMRSETLDPDFPRRRAAAYRAYFEHMPLRERARPTPARMLLRSRHNWGRLARFHVLDGRQRRTPQACPRPGRGGSNRIDGRCRELLAPGRTMLGPAQERWFADGLAAAPERWNFIAQQTLMARASVRVDGRRRFSNDKWDGYPAARDRLLRAVAEGGLAQLRRAERRRARRVRRGPQARLRRRAGAARRDRVLSCTSITSEGRMQSAIDAIVRDNPHIVHGDSTRRGYVVVRRHRRALHGAAARDRGRHRPRHRRQHVGDVRGRRRATRRAARVA